jgi:Lactonase, 7-bladed beta-propeller
MRRRRVLQLGLGGISALSALPLIGAFVDTDDYNRKDSAFASDIHITPNGKFLYGAVRTTSMLHGYKIDPEKGTLTGIGKWPTEKNPRGFNIDPRGKFLLAVGMDSASLTVHAIDRNSGKLKTVKQYSMGRQPNWIEIVDRIRDEPTLMSPRAGPAHRGGRERSSHYGIEKRALAHARRC